MPNWCENHLKIKGKEKDIDNFQEKINPKAFLNSFIPTPKALTKQQSPPKRKHQAQKNIDKYGSEDWYNWNIKNWGTKWDFEVTDSFSNHINKANNKQLNYYFDTAWGPPIEGITTISKKYPNLKFTLKYDEPGMCFKGTTIIQAGITNDTCKNY